AATPAKILAPLRRLPTRGNYLIAGAPQRRRWRPSGLAAAGSRRGRSRPRGARGARDPTGVAGQTHGVSRATTRRPSRPPSGVQSLMRGAVIGPARTDLVEEPSGSSWLARGLPSGAEAAEVSRQSRGKPDPQPAPLVTGGELEIRCEASGRHHLLELAGELDL